MTHQAAPRSIHDAPAAKRRKSGGSRKPRRRGGKVLPLCLAAAIVGAGGYVGYTHFGSAGASTLAQRPDSGAQFVDLLIDGWSLRTLEGRAVTVTWEGSSPRAIQFTGVTSTDLRELLRSSPDIVRTALARQLDPSTDLTCDSDGCSSTAGMSADDLLLNGNSDAAELLRANGITSGLLRARVEVPASTTSVTLEADGYAATTLSVVPATVDPDQSADETVEPDLGNGFQRGRWLVSAGLGQLFVPDAAWLGAAEQRTAQFPATPGELPTNALSRLTADTPAFVAVTGLGAPLEVADQWTSSQLTLATSPAQGCSVGVLCYPGTLDVSQDVAPPQYASVSSDGKDGVVGLDDRVVTVDLPAPIRQVDVDGELSGRLSLRFLTISLYRGSSLTPADWAGMVDADDRAEYTVADVLEHVRLAGVTWTATS